MTDEFRVVNCVFVLHTHEHVLHRSEWDARVICSVELCWLVSVCVSACDCVGRVSTKHSCARTERAWPKQKHCDKQFKCAISAWQYVLWCDSVVWVEQAYGMWRVAEPSWWHYLWANRNKFLIRALFPKKKRIPIDIFFVYQRTFGSVYRRTTARGRNNEILIPRSRNFSSSVFSFTTRVSYVIPYKNPHSISWRRHWAHKYQDTLRIAMLRRCRRSHTRK